MTGHKANGGFGAGYSRAARAASWSRQSTGDVLISAAGHTDGGSSPAPRVIRYHNAGVLQGEIDLGAATYSGPGNLAVDPAGSAAV